MNFLISGDSWSQGEWDGDWRIEPSLYCVHHAGITQYLKDAGHIVDNAGAGAIGNFIAMNNLKQCITTAHDVVIFFYTDPLRDATVEQLQHDLPFEVARLVTMYVIDQLNYIKQNYKSKVILIGGYAELDQNLEFGNIDFIIPSFCKFLQPNFKDSIYSISPNWKHNINIPVIGYKKQKEQYLEIIQEGDRKLKDFKQYPEYFYPDGAHPNRHAHRLLTNKVLELLAV